MREICPYAGKEKWAASGREKGTWVWMLDRGISKGLGVDLSVDVQFR